MSDRTMPILMLEFLIDNIFVSFGGTLFQQVVGIPMGTNYASLLADLFLYSYESEFLQKLVGISPKMMRTKLYRLSLYLPALEDISMEEILQI
jgi:hypothetical protein